jgi:hypothetical protein
MDVREINEQIRHISHIFEDVLAERGLLESKLFPISEYISLSCYQCYEYQFDVMKRVFSRISPEELAKQSKKLLSDIHALSITYCWLYWSLGRMGKIFNEYGDDTSNEPEEKREQWKWMLEQWHSLGTNYFNTDKPSVASSGYVNLAFEDETIDWLHNNMEPVTVEQTKKIRRAFGSVDLYAFLEECDARAKIVDHGPYSVGDDEILVASEYTNLHDGKGDLWLPWSDTEAKLPSSSLGVAMTMKDVTARFNDVGTMTIEPGDYSKRVTGAVVYANRGNKGVPMGFDELDADSEAADAAQAELYMKFAEWDKERLMVAGAIAYWRGFARYTDVVGITDKIDWDIADDIKEKYVPFFMNTDADPAFMRFGRFDEEMEEDPTLYLLPE